MAGTGYETYSQLQLHALFSSETWSNLRFADRINACQEVENRYAAANGVKPCTVTHRQMDGSAYGEQGGGIICLNTSLVRDGVFLTSYTDENGVSCQERTEALAPSWNVLDTVYHEGTHGIQEMTGAIPATYISPDMDEDLYRIQGIEKEAYTAGQANTLDALAAVEEASEKLDPKREEYFASVRADTFQPALQNAAAHYNDPNIEQVLSNVIADRDNNVVPEHPSESYKAISGLCDSYGMYAGSAQEAESAAPTVQEVDDGLSVGAAYAAPDPTQIQDDGLDYYGGGEEQGDGMDTGLEIN